MTVNLPYNFNPRDYQIPFWRAADELLRLFVVWPRRHGKDKTFFNKLTEKAIQRTGNYFYIFPEYGQGKKALWNNVDKDGFRTIDHIPKQLIARTNNTEMLIELVNGSTIQIVGASNIDRVVGSNPAGVVFSEYSLIDPMVWGYLWPILVENGGFAWFNCTPRGNNHAKKLLDASKDNPDWFTQHLNAKECSVFTDEELNKIRDEYFELYGDYHLFDQEFMTSFDAPVMGAYYATHMKRVEDEGRICSVPYDSSVPVTTAWDLGIGDSTTIWFYQTVGKEIHVIDYCENNGESIGHYAGVVNSKGYSYIKHNWPHDGAARELGTGKTRQEVAKEHGLNVTIMPLQSVDDGIEASRNLLGRCWFDAKKCEKGIEALKNYSKDFDELKKVYRQRPRHDWASHGADGFRQMAMSYQGVKEVPVHRFDSFYAKKAGVSQPSNYNVFTRGM
jgi:phage terminase large subunit